MRTANFRRGDGKFGVEDSSANVAPEQRAKPRGKPFQKGAPRPDNSGRKKGTPNKWSQVAAEIMERKGVNPIGEMCDEVVALKGQDNLGARSLRSKLLADLASFAYPKKRELSGALQVDVLEASRVALNAARDRMARLQKAEGPTEKPATSSAPATPLPEPTKRLADYTDAELDAMSNEELERLANEPGAD